MSDELHHPIHLAVRGGPAALERLTAQQRASLDARDERGVTALMLACRILGWRIVSAHAEADTSAACAWLLANGADPTLRDDDGWTALHWAAQQAREACVRALLEAGAPLDARDHQGRTPLMVAMLSEPVFNRARERIVEAMLHHRPDVDAHDDHGWTALHFAAAALEEDPYDAIAFYLATAGARKHPNHAGQTPADLRAWKLGQFDDQYPIALPDQTLVPETQPRELEPQLVARLLTELVPEPFDAAQPSQSWSRGAVEPWMVLADWLQAHGDPRGELIAASIACTRVGARKRQPLRDHQRRAAAKAHSLTHFALYRADPLAPIGNSTLVQTRLTHGLVSAAFVAPGRYRGTADAQRMCHAASTLLRFEPLLAELRLRPPSYLDWPELIERLAKLPPAPRLRRLVLDKLPGKLPNLEALVPVFPGLRSLWLIGAAKLHSGVLRWPGIKHLRLRHGKNNIQLRGLFDLSLDFPDLTHLDLGLPPGAPYNDCENSESELEGAVAILDSFAQLPHLRLCPLKAELAEGILRCGLIRRLRTLELVRVQGQAFEHLIRHAGRLRELERVHVVPDRKAKCDDEIERLRELIPGIVINRRARLRRRGRACAWTL
jgi:hypothetical protein